jgi:hypothetical protein
MKKSTRRTREPRSTKRPVLDWFSAYHQARRRAEIPPPPPSTRTLIKAFWPSALPYYSALNPVFLNDNLSVQKLNRLPAWLLRDGLMPLQWFFHSFPKPQGFKSRFYVHEELAPIVPTPWRPFCGTYRLESSNPPPSAREPKGLILAGVVMDAFCGIEHLQKSLDRIIARYGKAALASMELLSFLPMDQHSRDLQPQHQYHSEYWLRLCRALGASIKPLSWKELTGLETLADYDFLELNEGLVCADSYLSHLLASKGARFFDQAPRPRSMSGSGDSSWVDISPMHGFRLSGKLEGAYALAGEEKELESAAEHFRQLAVLTDAPAHYPYPWPDWFNAWVELASRKARRGHENGRGDKKGEARA